MKKMKLIRALFVAGCFMIAAALMPTPTAHALSNPVVLPTFADLVDKLSPTVVNISTTQKVKGGTGVQFFGLPPDQLPDDPRFAPFKDFLKRYQEGNDDIEREVTSLGSGVIVDASGFIITNNHVINEAEDITVITVDNTKYKAKIIGRDAKTDLALLKIDAGKPLPAVTLGDSDKVRVGDWVLAIGNPYGLGGTVTHGIISARERSINEGPFDDFLQTDAPINRGNSGGPLFNTSGEVIGITTAIFSPSGGNIGIGFAIPANLAKPIIEQLKKFGKVHRAWLGVKIQTVSEEMAESIGLPKAAGAMVVDVMRDSPGGKAGIKSGDIITKFDGKDITEMRFLPRIVAETKIGKTVEITVWRKGGYQTLKATLREMEEPSATTGANEEGGVAQPKANVATESLLGMELAALTPTLRSQYSLGDDAKGIVVVDVSRKSDAAQRQIAAGDVISEVNGEAVSNPADMKKQVEAARKAKRKFVLLRVQHGEETNFITLPMEEKK